MPVNVVAALSASSAGTNPSLRLVALERGHLALHEQIEHRYRKRGLAMPLAPYHAFVDELLSGGSNGRSLHSQGPGYLTGLMWPGSEFRHGPQVFLLQGGQPFESDSKEVSV